jgi:hypothetical protein
MSEMCRHQSFGIRAKEITVNAEGPSRSSGFGGPMRVAKGIEPGEA